MWHFFCFLIYSRKKLKLYKKTRNAQWRRSVLLCNFKIMEIKCIWEVMKWTIMKRTTAEILWTGFYLFSIVHVESARGDRVVFFRIRHHRPEHHHHPPMVSYPTWLLILIYLYLLSSLTFFGHNEQRLMDPPRHFVCGGEFSGNMEIEGLEVLRIKL